MFIINNKEINYNNNQNYLIAELCCNFCGDMDLAKEFVLEAKNNGADAIKLQKRDNKILFTEKAYNTKYESKNAFADTYGKHRDKLELSIDNIKIIYDYSKSINLDFIITPFDLNSFELIENNLNVDAYKISSYDFVNLPLIRKILSSNKPVILSTGAQNMDDVIKIYNESIKINRNICIMQCTSSYPCKNEYANINVIDTYRKELKNIVIGFSCHNDDIDVPIAAYSKGALIIEKHFTTDRTLKGTDNVFSLTPELLKKLKNTLNNIQLSFGTDKKTKMDIEFKPFLKLSKKMVISNNLKKNHILTENDISIKSPGDGLSPIFYDDFIGKKINKNLNYEENLTFDDIYNETSNI